MPALAFLIANRKLVRFDQRWRRKTVPISDGLVVLRRFIRAAVFETNESILSEWHQVGEQKTIGRLDLVVGAHGLLGTLGAYRMPGERKRHVQTAPIVSTA